MTKRSLGMIAAAVLAAAPALTLQLCDGGSARHAADTTAPGQDTPADAWPIGEQRSYDVEFFSDLEGAMQGQGVGFELSGSLRLVLTAVERRAQDTRVAAALSARSLHQRAGGKQQSLAADANRALAQPFAVAFDARGQITEIQLDDRIDPMLHAMVRAVISGLQLVRPADARAATWESLETDASGRLLARYTRTGALAYRKQAVRYVDGSTGGGMQRDRELQVTLALRKAGAIDSSHMIRSEALRGTAGAIQSRTEVKLRLIQIGRAAAAPIALAAHRASDLSALANMDAARKEQYRALAQGHSVEQLVRVFVELDPEDGHGQADAVTRLTAVLHTLGQPGVDATVKAVRETDTLEVARLLMAGLQSAHTPEAQAGLTQLAGDREIDPEIRDGALSLLGMSEAPTPDTIDFLRDTWANAEQEPELREGAVLAMGGALRHADLGDPQVAQASDASLTRLLQEVQQQSDPDRARLLLDALGNSGAPRAIEGLSPKLDSDDARLRASSAYALRHVQDPQADRLLADAMLSDEAPAVRLDALRAMLYRDLSEETRAALIDALQHDEEERVRRMAAEVASKYLDDDAVRAALELAAERDPSEGVRHEAVQSLDDSAMHQGEDEP